MDLWKSLFISHSPSVLYGAIKYRYKYKYSSVGSITRTMYLSLSRV